MSEPTISFKTYFLDRFQPYFQLKREQTNSCCICSSETPCLPQTAALPHVTSFKKMKHFSAICVSRHIKQPYVIVFCWPLSCCKAGPHSRCARRKWQEAFWNTLSHSTLINQPYNSYTSGHCIRCCVWHRAIPRFLSVCPDLAFSAEDLWERMRNSKMWIPSESSITQLWWRVRGLSDEQRIARHPELYQN